MLANQLELVVPIPEAFRTQARATLFYDVGGVFSTGGVEFLDRLGDPLSYDYNSDALKHSVGVSVEWLAPVGLLKFSVAQPLNPQEETKRLFEDRTEVFQFTVGNAF
jgi:outer membrane protein insertion porin family